MNQMTELRTIVLGGAVLSLALGTATVVPGGSVSATHSCSGYRPADTSEVSCAVSYPSTNQLLSLLWQPSLPSGWTLGTVSGDGAPEVNGTNIIFTGSLVNNPLSFAYRVVVPDGETGTKAIGGAAEYLLNGMINPASVDATPNPLEVSQLFYLVVNSAYGGAVPASGTNIFVSGTGIACSVTNSPVEGGGTQYVCMAAEVVGNASTQVSPTNVTLTLTNDATLSWQWTTNYYLAFNPVGSGTVDRSSGWCVAGSNVIVTATPSNNHHFVGWTGETNGCAWVGNVITAAMTQARSLTATFALDQHTLTVTSAYGGAWPGTLTTNWGTVVSQWVTNSPVVDGGTQYVCAGASVAGNESSQVSSTNATLTLTNDAALSWAWATNYWLGVGTTGDGTVDVISGWQGGGAEVVVTATAGEHWHFAGWSGETNGCGWAGNVVTAVMTQARSLAATFALDQHTLTVTSAYGGAWPGTLTTNWGTVVSQWVTNSPVVSGGTQYVCAAASVVGNVYTQVSPTNVTLTMTNDATLIWQWATNCYLTLSVNGSGSVNRGSGWCTLGSNVMVTATPSNHWHFVTWSGDTNGCTLAGNVITAAMTQARSLAATFALDQHTLTVTSAYGGAWPGTLTTNWGTVVSQWVTNSPVVSGGTQYVCAAASVVGNVYTQVSPTNVTLTLTNNTTLRWSWQTNLWLTLAWGPGGSITNKSSGWYPARIAVSNITATASNHYHFLGWSGDTNGCTISSNRITIPTNAMIVTRQLMASFQLDQHKVVVSTAYGTAQPPKGTNLYLYGTNLTCAILDSPVAYGQTQYVCTGWTGTGSVSPSGSTTNTGLFTLTNDTSITWRWGTNFWLELVAGPGGSITTATSGWYAAWMTVSNIEATASNHYHFTAWSGDTNGCSISSNRVSAPMSRSRQLTASFGIDQQKLVVTTPYGTAQPPAGTNLFSCGTNVVCSILDSPVLNGTTQYVCTGWTGSGSVPLSGSATNTGVFALTEDSAVAWQWKTQYWFAAGSEPGGSVTAVNGWYDPEGTATASVSVSSGFCFVNWVGDVPPEAATNPSVVLAMNQPRAITAHVSVDTNLIHASQASDGYRSPETNRVVSCQFHYPADRNMISLLWTVDLPGGWGVAAASGNGSPQVVGNEILFAGVLTNNPIEFTYTLTIPGNAATTNELGGSVEFQFEGMANAVGIAALPDPLLLQRYHSADYRASYWVMDAAEANRVLAYWRAGGYQVNPLGYDGYASGAGSTNGGYHSADYRTNRWVIDGTEANRVLAYMRANGYHVDPAGNDGYVAGPAGGFRAESSGDKLMIPVQATQAGPGGYDPEGGVEISNVFTYSSALLSLLWRPQLPKGWELLSVSGDGSPELQHGEILWTGSLPPSPIRMAYTAHVPLWELRATGITAEVEYQVSGMPNAATLSPDPVLLELSARDADNDGLPDGWEAHYTGGATNMTPGADDDYDGANNLQELIAGTNPTNDASVLAIEQVTAPAVYGSVISWPSVSNRFYEVDRATNLVSPGFEPIAVGIPAFPPVNVYTDAVEGIEGAFYRITVENQ